MKSSCAEEKLKTSYGGHHNIPQFYKKSLNFTSLKLGDSRTVEKIRKKSVQAPTSCEPQHQPSNSDFARLMIIIAEKKPTAARNTPKIHFLISISIRICIQRTNYYMFNITSNDKTRNKWMRSTNYLYYCSNVSSLISYKHLHYVGSYSHHKYTSAHCSAVFTVYVLWVQPCDLIYPFI